MNYSLLLLFWHHCVLMPYVTLFLEDRALSENFTLFGHLGRKAVYLEFSLCPFSHKSKLHDEIKNWGRKQ